MANLLYISITPEGIDFHGEFETFSDVMAFLLENDDIDVNSMRAIPLQFINIEDRSKIERLRANPGMKAAFLEGYVKDKKDDQILKERDEQMRRSELWKAAFAKQAQSNQKTPPAKKTEIPASEDKNQSTRSLAPAEQNPDQEKVDPGDGIKKTPVEKDSSQMTVGEHLVSEYTDDGREIDAILNDIQKPDLYETLTPDFRKANPLKSITKKAMFFQLLADHGVEVPSD